MRRFLFALSLLFWCAPALHAQPVALFYMTNDPSSIRSFLAHAAKIGVLVPTWYEVDRNGLVTGAPNPLVLKTAQSEGLPVMPIVSLRGRAEFHALAGNVAAQERMNVALLREAQLHGYTGFQFDFENLSYLDRDGLTALVARSAKTLHQAGLKLTIATVPNAPGYPGGGGFSKWIYSDWRGVYDLGALAKYVDLVCLMTYDQHTRWTTPGPVAGWQWTMENLDYALKFVPKSKLSLGIPLYGYHWYTGAPTVDKSTGQERPDVTARAISAPNAEQLAKEYGGKMEWDEGDRSSFFYFYRDQMREWVFFTDLRTFRARYRLAANQGLEGFCAWVLGMEDPRIWSFLPNRRTK